MCNISYKKSCYSPTKKYLNNLKFKYTSYNRVGLMQSHTMQMHGVHTKAGCISHFTSKNILYLSSYFCICNISSWVCTAKAPRFIFVLGPDMSQTGPDSEYKWLGMWKKELKYHRLKRTDVYIAVSISAFRCKKSEVLCLQPRQCHRAQPPLTLQQFSMNHVKYEYNIL